MTNEQIFAAVLAAAIIIILVIVIKTTGTSYSPYTRKRLMTRPETVMYAKITEALRGSPYDLHAQVSMGAIIDVKKGVDRRKRLGLRNRFDRKIIDYVISNRNGYAVLLIELDDSSHILSKDMDRDRLTASAGYKTLRYRDVKSIPVSRLRSDIQNAIEDQ